MEGAVCLSVPRADARASHPSGRCIRAAHAHTEAEAPRAELRAVRAEVQAMLSWAGGGQVGVWCREPRG